MKTKLVRLFAVLLILSAAVQTHAQGTAFTYQGRLNGISGPATGTYDFQFAVYDAVGAGNLIAGPIINSAVSVSNGLFTTTIDAGSAAFNGNARWLEIAVRTNGSTTFFTLSPRQAFTASPYSIMAGTITGPVAATQLSGTIPSSAVAGTYGSPITLNNANNQLAGSFIGNGTGLTNVNAILLGGMAASNFWQNSGNNVSPGQFIGSTNNQAVEIRASNKVALVISAGRYDAPNIKGGAAVNTIDSIVQGAVIAGGGSTNAGGFFSSNRISSDFSTISGGSGNWIQTAADHAAIGGGLGNVIGLNASDSVIAGGAQNIATNGIYATIGGGYQNRSISPYATVAGGFGNIASNYYAAVGGGIKNSAGDFSATVIGGANNLASAPYATVSGGYSNVATGYYSFAAGQNANAIHDGAFVWADSQTPVFASTAKDQFLVRAKGGFGINTNNPNGSALNVAGNINATSFSGNGIGLSNLNATTLNGADATGFWQASGNNVSTGQFFGSTNYQPVELRANNQTALMILPTPNDSPSIQGGAALNFIGSEVQGSVIAGGGTSNFQGQISGQVINSEYSSISGGSGNHIFTSSDHSSIGGGMGNSILHSYESMIGGGQYNVVQATHHGFIGGGQNNYVVNDYGVVAGGSSNQVNGGTFGAIGGGINNFVTNSYAVVSGGYYNTAGGYASTVPGGYSNFTSASYSLAAGHLAQAVHQGAFVWADSQNSPTTSTGNDQFLIRAQGGVAINTNNPNGSALNVVGNVNASSFSGDGSNLTNINAAQLTGNVPAGQLSGNYTNSLTLANANNSYAGSALSISGNKTGGWPSPVATIVNTSTATTASPALRVLAAGTTSDGALNVSATGNGLIARFGNATAFVADITTNGTVDASTFNGSFTGGSVRVGAAGTTISTLQAGQAAMPGASGSTNFTIAFPQTFSGVPKVIFSLGNDPAFPNVNDTFGSSISSVTTTNFRINVVRLDSTGGWSQQLRVNWQAWQ